MTTYPVPKPVKEPKKRKKPKPRTPERRLIIEIDHIDSDICLIVNNFRCILCGGRANQNHHFFHKSNYGSIRFEEDNHWPMDFACHRRKIHDAGDTEPLRDKIIGEIGQERFDQLKKKGRFLAERSAPYLRSVLQIKQKRLLTVTDMWPDRVVGLSKTGLKRLAKVRRLFS